MSVEFVTVKNTVVPAVSVDQMRKIDHLATEVFGPNLYQMMENAGRNLALQSLFILGKNRRKKSVLACCGTGGNGGGTICAARHLANHGISVHVAVTDVAGLSEVPGWQRHIFQGTGWPVASIEAVDANNFDLIIDGVIGYSLSGAPHGSALLAIEKINDSSAKVLSLDVPSGVDPDTGEAVGEAVLPDQTVTLALPKIGMNQKNSGTILLGDIGIPIAVYQQMKLAYTSPFEDNYLVEITPLIA